jgi:2-polyprenyl-3-methyl-5-hydroxy-6-metoxy-1,4-benzoquinol methylase
MHWSTLAGCRYGELPGELRRSQRDTGFAHSLELVRLQTDYTVDKVSRVLAEKVQSLTVLDAGAGAGFMGAQLSHVFKPAVLPARTL